MGFDDLLAPLDWGRQGLVNTGEGLSGLFGGDFSRQNFAKIMPGVAGLGAGLLTGGTMAGPAAALTMALTQGIGKQFNPTDMKAQTTQDLVGKLGGDKDSTLQNLGVGLATDPFTYAGLGMAGRLARGGSAAGKAANLASAGAGAAEGADALGAGVGAADAAGGGGRLGEMLGLRRGIGKVHYDPSMGQMRIGAGRDIVLPESSQIWGDLREGWEPGLMGQTGGGPGQRYVALLNDAGIAPDVARQTARHEMYHGMIDQALDTGKTAGLSPLQRATAGLYSSGGDTGMRRGLGLLLDETGAHAAEQSSPLAQLLSGGKHLFGGRGSGARAWYSGQIHDASPTIGKLFDALGYAPQAAKYAGYGAGGGAAGLGLYGVGNELLK